MTEQSQNTTIPNGALLQIANNILDLLEYDSELKDEDDLFSDQFFIVIVSHLVTDDKFAIKPGETEEEQVESLDKLIAFLSNIIDKDLSIISAEGIIIDHDKLSTKRLLELIEELIKALKNENDEYESQSEHHLSKEESIDQKQKQFTNESNSDIMQRGNISDANINRNHHNLLDDGGDVDEEEDGDEDSNHKHKKQKPAKPKEKEKEQQANLSISNDEHLDTDKLMTNEMKADYSEQERRKSEHSESMKEIEASNKKDNTTKEEKKTEREEEENESMMTDPRAQSCFEALEYEKMVKLKQGEYDESLIRKTLTENDLSRFERVLIENGEEEQESERQYPMGIDYNENNPNAQNETPVMNVSHISEVSKSKENSELQAKINSKSRKNESIDKKKDHNRYNNNKNTNNNKKVVKEQEDVPSLLEDSYKNQQSHTSSYYMEQHNNKYIEYDSDEDQGLNSLTGHSIHSVPQAHTKFKLNSSSSTEQQKKSSNQSSSKKNISHKDSANSKISKESKYNKDSKTNTNNNKKSNHHQSQSDISQSSLLSISQNSQLKVPKSKSENENIVEEIPLSDEVLKYEIIKEFKRLYGNKLDKIFLKQNIQNSHNILDIILRNIKLAKQKMMKISNKVQDSDDQITMEFMHRHQKELQYILDYYKKEKNKRSKYQERALNTLTKNVCLMKKAQEVQTKKMEAEIERKKKARETNHQQEQVRICNEIYSKALQLEKEKYLEEISYQMELRQRENEEKRRSMMEVEKYYTDKIAILKEILKREKKERNFEHKVKIQFLSRLEKEKKGEFKRQIEKVFEKFDEEEKKTDIEDKNQEEIEKIIKNYYNK